MDALFEEVDPLPFLLTLLVGLVGGLLARRALERRGLGHVVATWRRQPGLGRDVILVALVGAATGSVWLALPLVLGAGADLPGDAASHARVVQEIAAHRLDRGWIGGYAGGFPFGPHYQSGALLGAAGLVRLGLHPIAATLGVGVIGMLVTPMLFTAGARAAGASRSAALLGGLFLSWLWPLYHWVGGIGVMLAKGLVSQAFATPICLATAIVVLTGKPRGAGPVLASLAVASHAQIAVCAFGATLPAVALFGDRALRRNYAYAAIAGAIVAVAHYGPGAASFALPFSWADVPLFDTLGWGTERLPRWFVAGQLFDQQRAPALTVLLWVSTIVLLFATRSRPAKGALLFLATTIFFSVAGVELQPVLGNRLFELFSPVRMMCVLPFAAATVVVVAWTEIRAVLAALSGRGGLATIGRGRIPELVAVGAVVVFAGWPQHRAVREWTAALAARASARCADEGFAGFDDDGILRAIAIPYPARFVVEDEDRKRLQTPCPVRRGLELHSRNDLGAGTAGPGSQLGVTTAAFRALRLGQPGAADRAEALGVRTVLHPTTVAPVPKDGWETAAEAGAARVSKRVGGTDLIGVGCITSTWEGADRALRDALFADLRQAAPDALRPRDLVELVADAGPVRRRPRYAAGCDARGADVTILDWAPGDVTGLVDSPAPVDVVVRATYLPTWEVAVDGAAAPYRHVAPGFLAVRIPAGRHELRAVAHGLPHYGLGLVLASIFVIALAAWAGRRRVLAYTAAPCRRRWFRTRPSSSP